jgi:phosphatidylglycerophosphate synthase
LVDRRPLKTRGRTSAKAVAAALARWGVRPNHVSVAGVGFALLAAAALVSLQHVSRPMQAALLVVAAAAIQLRLLCNLLDGLLAVENGLKSATGELYNDVPDRFADVLIIAAAGYAITWDWGPPLGWAAAAAALLTAYVRLLGGALGTPQHFFGPMAKPHRMAILTAACLLSFGELAASDLKGRVLATALGVILLGSLATFARRLQLIAEELNAR